MTRSTRLLSSAAPGAHWHPTINSAAQTPPRRLFVAHRMAAVVATSGGFKMLPARARKASVGLSVLWPFAPPALPGFLTTMASADFSTALTAEISPGKVRERSARAAGLYQERHSVTVGFRVSQHAHRPPLASLSVPVRTVAPLACPAFSSPVTRLTLGSPTILVTLLGNLLSDCAFTPMPGTLGAISRSRTTPGRRQRIPRQHFPRDLALKSNASSIEGATQQKVLV